MHTTDTTPPPEGTQKGEWTLAYTFGDVLHYCAARPGGEIIDAAGLLVPASTSGQPATTTDPAQARHFATEAEALAALAPYRHWLERDPAPHRVSESEATA